MLFLRLLRRNSWSCWVMDDPTLGLGAGGLLRCLYVSSEVAE